MADLNADRPAEIHIFTDHLAHNHANWSLAGGLIAAAFVFVGVLIGAQDNSSLQA